jgi:hypothetical protein
LIVAAAASSACGYHPALSSGDRGARNKRERKVDDAERPGDEAGGFRAVEQRLS